MIQKVLIANRGEIVVRIARTLQQMGIRAAAVYSDPDRRSFHVASADEAYALPGETAAETYLRKDKVIEIARHCGADAVHPGYGFLSENPDFAHACRDAGLTFIGPRSEVMRLTGNKVAAKKALTAAGVPVVPGWTGERTDDLQRVSQEARRIGYPLLVKAAAGGGGKGMRLVEKDSDLPAAWEAAQREALAAFGDGHVFLEKYLVAPRHVEFQILGDEHGNVVHLFERECSIQRRHQKIIEETPSPALTPEIRANMAEAAVRAAKAVGYTNAGTVEFLLAESGEFYFLEINTRLQVEHPITEVTLGRDLVREQVLVAAGERLTFRQADLLPSGHAIECRIYAEDASRGFLPSTGTLQQYVAPAGPYVRVDSGVESGSEVTVHYDPMLAKLICWGRTREEALARSAWALDRFVVLGLTTNIPFLRRVLAEADFCAGRTHTGYLTEHPELSGAGALEVIADEVYIAAALATLLPGGGSPAAGAELGSARQRNPWSSGMAWRSA